jgi:F420-dependent oxidoreductase-like protein
MRFGLFVPQGWRLDLVGIEPARQWEAMLAVARLADAGPWESIWVYDHFHTVPVPTDQATHEAWTLMAAFAAATSRVRLGQMCSCMGYRNPMYLAKVAATVDAISGGRTEMGIGAGWYEHEWDAYGYGFPPAGERIAMLAEGVQIMKQAWTDGVATLAGEHYQVDGAICRPLPLQAGGIPLWIAGGGEKKTLRIAAEHAAYTNYNVVIGRTQAEVDDRLARLEEHYRPYLAAELLAATAEQYRTGPLVGTPDQLVERLKALQAAGMTYAITYFQEAAYDDSGIRLFVDEVIPALA